jgi:hypothetical protein
MAYRNGTYIAFHAGGTSDPTQSDIKYFNIMKAWHEHDHVDFRFVNSHEKTYAVRDSSLRETLKGRLRERINNSRNLVLIVGPTTRLDIDWVPFELSYAVDKCNLPIVVSYTGYTAITRPLQLRGLWPTVLEDRIVRNAVRAIHIPFKKEAIMDAIGQFSHDRQPATALNYYTLEAHRAFGIAV